MKILLLTPGINKKYNDNYYSYLHIAHAGNPVLAISNIQNINKGSGLEFSPIEENPDDNIRVCRIYDTIREQTGIFNYRKKYPAIQKIVAGFEPELIFCENAMNIHLAGHIKKNFNIPLILRVEFTYHRSRPFRYLGRDELIRRGSVFDQIAKPAALSYWRWICSQTDALISCYFDDVNNHDRGLLFRSCPVATTFVPWPTHPLVNIRDIQKDRSKAIFIGAFETHKNIEEFLWTLPVLFQNTPLRKFYIVGSGQHESVITRLKSVNGDKVVHIPALGRDECLKKIAESYFTYAPARWGGWGLIGDSWAMKTPLVVTNNHYGFRDHIDSIVTNRDKIVHDVMRLYNDSDLYESIREEGYRRFSRLHRWDLVGQEYLKVMQRTLLLWRGAKRDN